MTLCKSTLVTWLKCSFDKNQHILIHHPPLRLDWIIKQIPLSTSATISCYILLFSTSFHVSYECCFCFCLLCCPVLFTHLSGSTLWDGASCIYIWAAKMLNRTCWQANRTGPVANPSLRSAAEGFPSWVAPDVKSKTSSTSYRAEKNVKTYYNSIFLWTLNSILHTIIAW